MGHRSGINSSNRLRCGEVQPIQVPIALGAMKTGVDRGAEMLDITLRNHLEHRVETELLARLRESQVVPVSRFELPDARRYPGRAMYLEPIIEASEELARRVRDAVTGGALALTLGGDHSVSIGSIAGAAAACNRLGVIWIDAHGDLNSTESTLSGRVHGMPMAVALGRGDERLTGLLDITPKVAFDDAFLIGIRLLDPGEKQWIGEGCCNIATMAQIDDHSLDATLAWVVDSLKVSGCDAVHISFDLDSLDPLLMPGTGTPVRGGFTYREAIRIMRTLRTSDLPIVSLDWVELNPDLDPTNASAEVAADLLAVVLGEEIV